MCVRDILSVYTALLIIRNAILNHLNPTKANNRIMVHLINEIKRENASKYQQIEIQPHLIYRNNFLSQVKKKKK